MSDNTTQQITRWTLELSPAARDALRNIDRPSASATGASTDVRIEWLKQIEAEEYRRLYKAVGAQWNWVDRLLLSPSVLRSLLDQPDRSVGRLCDASNAEVGFCELQRHSADEVEICYFGLLPDWTGKGLGKALFHRLLQDALEGAADDVRVWLTTCEFDSPAALPFYRRMGFVVTGEERYLQRLSASS
jgi:GNAT superfamily N-acetyltransferase